MVPTTNATFRDMPNTNSFRISIQNNLVPTTKTPKPVPQCLLVHTKQKKQTTKVTLSYDCRKTIPVDRCRHLEKGQPMCMTQYYRLFTTYRAPGIDHDSQISYQNKTQPAPQHVLVICKNQVR